MGGGISFDETKNFLVYIVVVVVWIFYGLDCVFIFGCIYVCVCVKYTYLLVIVVCTLKLTIHECTNQAIWFFESSCGRLLCAALHSMVDVDWQEGLKPAFAGRDLHLRDSQGSFSFSFNQRSSKWGFFATFPTLGNIFGVLWVFFVCKRVPVAVTFCYPSQPRVEVLRNVSLTIPAGKVRPPHVVIL